MMYNSYPVVRRFIFCAVHPDIVVLKGLNAISAELEPEVFVTGMIRYVIHDQLQTWNT